jgi:hypothetical protein
MVLQIGGWVKEPRSSAQSESPSRSHTAERARDDWRKKRDDDDDDSTEEEEEEEESTSERAQKNEEGDWRLTSPGRYACIGPSHSGKSELVIKIVASNYIWVNRPEHIIYCAPYLEDRQPYLRRLKAAVAASQGIFHCLDTIPTVRELHNILGVDPTQEEPEPAILILDDIMSFDHALRKRLTQLMVMESHHSNLTVILCQQNPFPPGPEFVTCNRNLTGRFILYQLNDWRGIVNINNIMFPGKKNFLPTCLTEAKEVLDCNYIFVNSYPFSKLRRRHTCYTCLFEEERKSDKSRPVFFDTERYITKDTR